MNDKQFISPIVKGAKMHLTFIVFAHTYTFHNIIFLPIDYNRKFFGTWKGIQNKTVCLY